MPMSLAHRSWPLFGVQFHPESVLTESGHRLLGNFLGLAGIECGPPPRGDWTETTTSSDDLTTQMRQPLHW
jgi:hypothetical protein